MNDAVIPAPKLEKRVGFYRGVRYEYESYLPTTDVRFIGGGPPDYHRAVAQANFSLLEGQRWNAWFLECARIPENDDERCGHAFGAHRLGFECTEDHRNASWDIWPPQVCDCTGFVRRAPLAVIEARGISS